MTYHFTTPATDWELVESSLYRSHRDVCNPNPRQRQTWEATLDVRAAEDGATARLLVSYWPGKGVHVIVVATSLDAPQRALDASRTAPAGRCNPSSAHDLAWLSTSRPGPGPQREEYTSYVTFQAAYHAWRAGVSAVRAHNSAPDFRPIRAAIVAVLWDLERFTRLAARTAN